MSPKINCQQKSNATKYEMSHKIKLSQDQMSDMIKCHIKENVTQHQILSKVKFHSK